MAGIERTERNGNRELARLMVSDEIYNFLFHRHGHYSTDVPGYLASLRDRLTTPEGEQLFSRAFTEYTAGDSFGSMVMGVGASPSRANQQKTLKEVIGELDRRLGRPLSSSMG